MIEQGRVCAGTPDECLAILERAQDQLGLTIVDCNFLFGGLTYQEAQCSIELFASKVMPRLKNRLPSWKGQLAGAR